jgi:uncharacterized membrane protein
MNDYFLVRWKKRWPIVPFTAILILIWWMLADRKKVHEIVLGAVIFVIVGILFPFRWGGENWDEPTRR